MTGLWVLVVVITNGAKIDIAFSQPVEYPRCVALQAMLFYNPDLMAPGVTWRAVCSKTTES